MIQITSTNGEVRVFPDYIFSTQRVRFVEGDYVVIDNIQYLCSSIKKLRDTGGNGFDTPVVPVITDLPFDGNRPVKRAGLPQVNPAAISVKTFLDKYFYPFVPATIAFNGSDATYEYGTQVSVTMYVRVTPNDETGIANRRIVDVTNQGQVIQVGAANEFSLNLLIQGNEETYQANKKRSFRALADVAGNGFPGTIQSALRDYNFYYPTFYGMSSSLTSAIAFSAFTRVIAPEQTKTFQLLLNGANQYIWFLTPFMYTRPVVKDQNGFDVSDSFVKEQFLITTPNKHPAWSFQYVVWRTTEPTTVNNKVFTISFS